MPCLNGDGQGGGTVPLHQAHIIATVRIDMVTEEITLTVPAYATRHEAGANKATLVTEDLRTDKDLARDALVQEFRVSWSW
jgi:hypothetical protein